VRDRDVIVWVRSPASSCNSVLSRVLEEANAGALREVTQWWVELTGRREAIQVTSSAASTAHSPQRSALLSFTSPSSIARERRRRGRAAWIQQSDEQWSATYYEQLQGLDAAPYIHPTSLAALRTAAALPIAKAHKRKSKGWPTLVHVPSRLDTWTW
jgi:hypothetical protein